MCALKASAMPGSFRRSAWRSSRARSGVPREGTLRGVGSRRVLHRNAPVVDAAGRPLPVFRRADAIVLGDARNLRGVLDDSAVRADEGAEHLFGRPMASRSPHAWIARVAQAADAADDGVGVGHFE